MRWMQVAIRPAKPFAFGLLEASATPVFGLPGNPVSAMVSFELFVRPAVRLMAGHSVLERLTVPATVVRPLRRRPDGKTHFVRSVLSLDGTGAWWVRPLVGQESHQLSVMAAANALVELPDGEGVDAGATVAVMVVAPERLEIVPTATARRRMTTVPVVLSARGATRAPIAARPGSAGTRDAVDGSARGHLRPDPRRPPDLGHRPLQPPVHLLHAGAGHVVPPRLLPPLLRRDRPGRRRRPLPRGRSGAPHRRASRWSGGASIGWSVVWPASGSPICR